MSGGLQGKPRRAPRVCDGKWSCKSLSQHHSGREWGQGTSPASLTLVVLPGEKQLLAVLAQVQHFRSLQCTWECKGFNPGSTLEHHSEFPC